MEAFKNTHVGKFTDLREEIEKLPTEELKDFWNDREFDQFLDEFKNVISKAFRNRGNKEVIADYISDKITPVMPFLPELGYSFDCEIHLLIYQSYSELLELCSTLQDQSTELKRNLAGSFNKYLDNILSTETMKIFSDDGIEQRLKFTVAVSDVTIEGPTFKVEEELRLHFQKQNGPFVAGLFGYNCTLQQVALEFMGNLYIYPLEGTDFPQRPGVYFIFHVGATQLYKGSQVTPSTRRPVYVGVSKTSIADHLKQHYDNIKNGRTAVGKRFKLSDFVVRFMIVDNKYYVGCIKEMMIAYFNPVWNKESGVGFSFGNATSDTNNSDN